MSVKIKIEQSKQDSYNNNRRHKIYGYYQYDNYETVPVTRQTVLFNECYSCKFLNRKTLVCKSPGDIIAPEELYDDFVEGFISREEYEAIMSNNKSNENPLDYAETSSECFEWNPIHKCDINAAELYDDNSTMYVTQPDDIVAKLKSYSSDDRISWLPVKKISL